MPQVAGIGPTIAQINRELKHDNLEIY
ncbi:peptide deformylase [Pseudoalteromonas tunicata D2]|uniref:Peptide deformylase n=1 Tax=Pseudoalteromonas tunicata D2 TaxID=87626 RepID=A4CAZ9_9GAMM|nr:peptide deformylase [Pseudoalteromonas tunicata D2]